MKKVKNFLSKNKILGVVGLASLFASSAQAAVTFDETAGFGGSIDLAFFYGGAALILTAYGSMFAIKRVISMFK